MFCIKCGKTALKGTVFCAECYSKGELSITLPEVMTFEVCPSCSRIRRGSRWLQEDTRSHMVSEMRKTAVLPHDAFLRRFNVAGLDPVEHSSNVRIEMAIARNGVERAETRQMHVMVKGNTCPTCNRRSGHYFESTIQVRATGRERAEVIHAAAEFIQNLCIEMERSEPDFFISGIKRTKGGVDISLSSSAIGGSIARAAAEHFGTGVHTTRKLYGQRDGRNVYRTTHLVRLPMLLRGDYVEYGGAYYRVRNTSGQIVLDGLGDSKQVRVDHAQAAGVHILGGPGLERNARVISRERGHIVVRDPETMDEVNIPLVEGRGQEGDTLLVVRIGKLLFSVPPDSS